MKSVVFNELGHKVEFKPKESFNQYLQLVTKDIKKYFDPKNLIKVACPACQSTKEQPAFQKLGFTYVECQNCQSLYLNPRPGAEAIQKFFTESESAQFWNQQLSQETKKSRDEKIYKIRLQWMRDTLKIYAPQAHSVLDFYSRNMDYLNEFLEAKIFSEVYLLNPYLEQPKLNIPPNGTVSLITDSKAQAFSQKIDTVCSFETLDFICDPHLTFKLAAQLLKKDGLFFVTTLSISGFDLQILWDQSSSIFPPDRINVLSKKGIRHLAEKFGFEIIEYSTPGILDLDIVENEYKQNARNTENRFVRGLLESQSETIRVDFQQFLQRNRLSSYVRLVLKKV